MLGPLYLSEKDQTKLLSDLCSAITQLINILERLEVHDPAELKEPTFRFGNEDIEEQE